MSLSQHVTAGELDGYLIGRLDPVEARRVETHCRSCESCARQRDLRRAARALTGQTSAGSTASACLSGTTLSRFASGTLEADERALVEGHLHDCQACRDELAVLRCDEQHGQA